MKNGLTVSTEHWERVDALRVDDVIESLRKRPERLYAVQKFTPSRPKKYDLSDVQQENSFKSLEELLAAVREWCG